MDVIVACATDDGEKFTDKHFGDANHYLIYKIDNRCYVCIKKIDNTVEEERFHGDPKKAKSVSSILSKENVKILLSKRFGPNIVRMKKSFVPVLVKTERIEDGLKIMLENLNKILEEWNRGENREYLTLR